MTVRSMHAPQAQFTAQPFHDRQVISCAAGAIHSLRSGKILHRFAVQDDTRGLHTDSVFECGTRGVGVDAPYDAGAAY